MNSQSRSQPEWRKAAVLIALMGAAQLPLSLAAHASSDLQSLGAIRSAAEALIRSQVPKSIGTSAREALVNAGYLDPRLRLANCAGTLKALRPAGSTLAARNTVAVSCVEGTPWTVYVPVLLESEGPVLVAKRALARGAIIDPTVVETQIQRLPGLASHYLSDTAELEGRHARRAIPAGAALTADAIAANLLIKRGQQVTLLTSVGGIEVRAMGRALADGGALERIRVQNLGSARIVEGIVQSADIVRIGQ